MKMYFFLDGSVKIGPITREQLLSQHLSDDTLVYYPDTNSWHPYAEIKDKILADSDETAHTAYMKHEPQDVSKDATVSKPQEESPKKRTKKVKNVRYLLYVFGFILLLTPKLLALYYEQKAEKMAKEMMDSGQYNPSKDKSQVSYKQYSKKGLSFTYPDNYVIYKDTVINEQWLVRCKNPLKSMEKIQFTIDTIEPETQEILKNYSREEICQNVFETTSEQLSIEFMKYDVSNRTIDKTEDYYSIMVDYVGTFEVCGRTDTMQGKLKVLVMDDYVVRCNTYTETEKDITAKVFDSMRFAPHKP